jgi:uncharacterized protein YjbI with pentapeptide repeats
MRVVGAAVAFGVTSWLLIKVAPQLLTARGDGAKRADDVARTRTAILALLAGSLAAIGAYYTHRTFGLNLQGQITERFTRAVDQLGNKDSVHVRLGGIYALERLARESSDDHKPILEILTAFVRDTAGAPAGAGTANPLPPSASVAIDVQATLTVLGRRTSEYDPDPPWGLDLAGVHVRGVHLRRAHLGRCDLSESQLDEADLTEAHLKDARLTGARLDAANLFEANLDGANLTGAHLREAKLTDACLKDADLVGASLPGARLEGANLTGAQLQGADLTGAHLQGADLSGANLDDAVLAGAELEGVVHSRSTVWPRGFDLASWGAAR